MEYVEFLRVRRALVIFAIVIFGIELVNLLVHQFGSVVSTSGHGNVDVSVAVGATHGISMRDLLAHVAIPLDIVLGVAGYGACVLATVFASSLNKENDFAHFAFTKPIGRGALALRHFAVDAAGILGAFAIVTIAILSTLVAMGLIGNVAVDARAFELAFLELGVAFMWYGILQAITASYRGKGGAIVGWSWAVFFVLVIIRHQPFLGPVFGTLVDVADFFNPLAYAPSIGMDRGVTTVATLAGGTLETQSAIVWAIAIVACAVAVRVWQRVEA